MLGLDASQSTRPKVRVRLKDGQGDTTVHLGRVIMTDSRFGPEKKRERSRSRSADLVRNRGRSQAELVLW